MLAVKAQRCKAQRCKAPRSNQHQQRARAAERMMHYSPCSVSWPAGVLTYGAAAAGFRRLCRTDFRNIACNELACGRRASACDQGQHFLLKYYMQAERRNAVSSAGCWSQERPGKSVSHP